MNCLYNGGIMNHDIILAHRPGQPTSLTPWSLCGLSYGWQWHIGSLSICWIYMCIIYISLLTVSFMCF